jgi:transposase-like protein
LLTHRRRAEQALVSVVATSYLLGVSTRRVKKLVEQLGMSVHRASVPLSRFYFAGVAGRG